jgi:hypothetical protein
VTSTDSASTVIYIPPDEADTVTGIRSPHTLDTRPRKYQRAGLHTRWALHHQTANCPVPSVSAWLPDTQKVLRQQLTLTDSGPSSAVDIVNEDPSESPDIPPSDHARVIPIIKNIVDKFYLPR